MRTNILNFILILSCFTGCTKEAENYLDIRAKRPSPLISAPKPVSDSKKSSYQIPEIQTAGDFANKIHIDPDYKGGSSDGSITRPYTSFNAVFSGKIPANTAFLIKRGTVLKEIIGRDGTGYHTVHTKMLYNNNFIGAYGEGARPVIMGLFIMRPSNGLTVRDLRMERQSKWGDHDAIISFDYLSDGPGSQNVTIAYNQIRGLYNPNGVKTYPFSNSSGPFAYPKHFIEGSCDNFILYHNEMWDCFRTGIVMMGYRAGHASNVKVVKNWVRKVYQMWHYNGMTKEIDMNEEGGNVATFYGKQPYLYVAGNYLDRSDTGYKAVISTGLEEAGVPVWGSGLNQGQIFEFNTLITGVSNGSGFYINTPEKTYIRHNVIDRSNKGLQAGNRNFGGNDSFPLHFEQPENYIYDNHLIRFDASQELSWPPGYCSLIEEANKGFKSYSEYEQYCKTNVIVGSDIDINNFWGNYTGN
jgi:hypothetical protein